MRSLIARSLYLLGASLLAVGLAWGLRPNLDANGLRAQYTPGPQRVERVAILTSNDDRFVANGSQTVKWTGYLYQGRASEVTFRVPVGVKARLVVGGDTVFDTFASPAQAEGAVAYPGAGFTPIAFEIATEATHPTYVQAGLEWKGLLGWQLVPAQYLYPQPATPSAAEQLIQQTVVSVAVAAIGLLLGLALVVSLAWPQRGALKTWTAAGLALLVIGAFALRLVFLSNVAAQPTVDIQGNGSDNQTYQANAVEYVRGHWPPGAAFYVQPGMALLLGSAYSVFGINLRLVEALQMALGALTTLVVFAIGRRTFNPLTGWIAALFWAISPLPIFYEAQVLTHGLEPIVGAVLVYVWLRAVAPQDSTLKQWVWVAALGLAMGLAALLRPTFLILAPFMALSLVWVKRPHWGAMAGWPILLAVVTCIPIAPVTWYNYQHNGGHFQLLTSNSDVTLYLGNNRDSTGLGEYSPAFLATHTLVRQGKTTYVGQTLADIRNDPTRWTELMLRKVALYLGNPELPNNVDFYLEGTRISPLLRALPLTFGPLMALALAGLAVGVTKRSLNYSILSVYFVTQIAVTVAYHVFSRFRAPLYSVLPVLAAFGLVYVIETIRDRRWRWTMVAVSAIVAGSLLVSAMPQAAESVMAKPVVTALPANAVALNTPISESLTLVGYDALPVVAPEDPFFITLYWRAEKPLPKDYFATVQLFAGELKVVQADQAIGTGSFPDYASSQWQPGQIVKDTFYLEMPGDAPTPTALTLLVAAYDRESGERLGETRFGVLPLTKREPLALPAEAMPVKATFGTDTLLSAYTIQERTLTLYWQAGTPLGADEVVFVHYFDASGTFVGGSDTKPRNGLYSTLAWQMEEGIVDEHPLPDGLAAGTYTVKVGLYDATTQNRVAVVDAEGNAVPDGELVLGSVVVK